MKHETEFLRALAFVLGVEGGFVDDPMDRGGRTQAGITQATYNAIARQQGWPQKDVRNLSRDEIRRIYDVEFWRRSGAHRLAMPMALVVFDTAVHSGPGLAQSLYRQSGGDVDRYLQLREAFLRRLVQADPSQKRFLQGWLNRLAKLRQAAQAT